MIIVIVIVLTSERSREASELKVMRTQDKEILAKWAAKGATKKRKKTT